jgi:hypothetical protein
MRYVRSLYVVHCKGALNSGEAQPGKAYYNIGCTQSVRHGIDDVVDADANAKSGETLGIGRAIGPFP